MLSFLIKLSSPLSFLSPTSVALQMGRKVNSAFLSPSRILLPSLFKQEEKSTQFFSLPLVSWCILLPSLFKQEEKSTQFFSLPLVSCFHRYLGKRKSPFNSSLSFSSLVSITLLVRGKVCWALLPPFHLLLPLLSRWEENLGSSLSLSSLVSIVVQVGGRLHFAPLSWFPCPWMHALSIMLLSLGSLAPQCVL